MARYSFRKAIKALSVGVLSAVGVAMGGGAVAQNNIIPDNTLGTEPSIIVPITPLVDGIQGGAERGKNLFHSFEQFDIGAATGALFLLRSDAIGNVFVRISTQNISEISGLLGTRNISSGIFLPSPANLYLINPSGIVLSDNAVLDIGGAFTATTADNLLFSDGTTFGKDTAATLTNVLTVSPSAYLFSSQDVGDIVVRTNQLGSNSFNVDRGLSVPLRENLNLIGGNVSIDGLGSPFGAGLVARGGNINVVATRAGRVDILADGTISLEENRVGGDILLSNNAILDTSLDNRGDIFLSGRDIQLNNSSVLRTGILLGVGSRDSRAGNVVIRSDTLSLENGSQIDTSINGTGNAGTVDIQTQRLLLTGARIENVNMPDQRETLSAIRSIVEETATGKGGEIIIRVPDIEISGGAAITNSTFGRGDSGNISIFSDTFILSGTSQESSSLSSIMSAVGKGAIGNGGNISIIADSNILVENGAGLTASTLGTGFSGSIRLVSEEILFRGRNRDGFPSAADVRIDVNASVPTDVTDTTRSNSIIVIAGNNFRLQDGAQLIASTEGSGNSGNIFVRAGNVTISGSTVTPLSPRLPAGFLTNTGTNSTGIGGNIIVEADALMIGEGAVLSSRSGGQGNAGDIILNIKNNILVRNGDIDTATTESNQADGGNIDINTRTLTLEGDGDITTRVFQGFGTGGRININATDYILASGDSDIIASSFSGRGGNITLKTKNFFGVGFEEASLFANPDDLDGNNQVDVNSNGSVTLSSVGLLGNDLASLSDTLLIPDQLIASSCIARNEDGQGTLVETGSDGIANNPDSGLASSFSTGTVQSNLSQDANVFIEEPNEIYQLADGRLVMGKACL